MFIELQYKLIYKFDQNEKIENTKKTNFSKTFIKICRIFGFEIIDQSNFSSPTFGKELNETLSEQGKDLLLFLLVKLI